MSVSHCLVNSEDREALLQSKDASDRSIEAQGDGAANGVPGFLSRLGGAAGDPRQRLGSHTYGLDWGRVTHMLTIILFVMSITLHNMNCPSSFHGGLRGLPRPARQVGTAHRQVSDTRPPTTASRSACRPATLRRADGGLSTSPQRVCDGRVARHQRREDRAHRHAAHVPRHQRGEGIRGAARAAT